MAEQITAYPLAWPVGWKRWDGTRERARWSVQTKPGHRQLTLAESRKRVTRELELLDVSAPVLSTNVDLNSLGNPRSGSAAPKDPGAAVYFRLGGRSIALACDKWDRVEDNVAALAAHIESMRGQARWGVGNREQAFTGYMALPAPEPPKPWWVVLGFKAAVPVDVAEAEYKKRARRAHPDVEGGSAELMAELNRAIDAARKGK